jgi:hypothetical protein
MRDFTENDTEEPSVPEADDKNHAGCAWIIGGGIVLMFLFPLLSFVR